MTRNQARFIIKLTISGRLPLIIGRRKFWHRLYDRAAAVVLGHSHPEERPGHADGLYAAMERYL